MGRHAFKGSAPARIGGAIVTPGAHGMAHPSIGPNAHRDLQHGRGANARWSKGGNPSRDIIWIPPGEKHWHGATATTAMTHIAISEALDGKTVDGMEKVSDAEFNG